MGQDIISRAELKSIVKTATTEAVNDAFVKAGMDISDPISLQKDLAFIRSARLAREKMTTKIFLTMVGVFATTAAGFTLAGLAGWLKTGAQ